MNDEVVASESFRTEATDTVKELLAQLPPECRRAIAPDEAALEDLVARLAGEGAEEILARLWIGDSDGER
ncbi:hypothetical protein ABIB75_007487 [Bradyrhizobium sp. GM2.2]|uniref:hypothetical protein n=1 Tax=Bradyrhizobium sp. GM2.2 TaxID=3156358 RepID=UPI003393E641